MIMGPILFITELKHYNHSERTSKKRIPKENKLNDRMKNEFSLEYTRDESKDKERMKTSQVSDSAKESCSHEEL